MSDFSWYDEATLLDGEHVYCAGTLVQCVRRWKRLFENQKVSAFIKLNKSPDNPRRLERGEIEQLALEPKLLTV